MLFGTFDILHKGHLNFFKQAKRLAKNSFLIVSVARDRNVKKIKNHLPLHSEKQRLVKIRKLSIVDKVILGGLGSHLPHIIRQKPSIIALGYDQKAYTKGLKSLLLKKGLNAKIKRLKAYKPEVFKSGLLKTKFYDKKNKRIFGGARR